MPVTVRKGRKPIMSARTYLPLALIMLVATATLAQAGGKQSKPRPKNAPVAVGTAASVNDPAAARIHNLQFISDGIRDANRDIPGAYLTSTDPQHALPYFNGTVDAVTLQNLNLVAQAPRTDTSPATQSARDHLLSVGIAVIPLPTQLAELNAIAAAPQQGANRQALPDVLAYYRELDMFAEWMNLELMQRRIERDRGTQYRDNRDVEAAASHAAEYGSGLSHLP